MRKTYSSSFKIIPLLLLFLFIWFCPFVNAQSNVDTILNRLNSSRFVDAVKNKMNGLEDRLVKKSLRTLNKLQEQEERIYKKLLSTKDSMEASFQLKEVKTRYAVMKDKIKNPYSGPTAVYLGKLDSLSTALKFLDANGLAKNLKNVIGNSEALQGKFNQTEEIKQFIKARKTELKQKLEQWGVVQNLKIFNKQAFYYAVQIKEYKKILSDPKKMEKKALELLSKTTFFQEFMAKHSLFSTLFRMPGDPANPDYLASLAGLQTRRQINTIIQQQISAGGPSAGQVFQQNVQAAQTQLNVLKDKIITSGGGSSDAEMPDFKVNNQKTKSFFDRLEYGTNFQTQKATSFFPVTTDLGFSIGYKLNDKSIVGFGGSYKLGWGRGWNNIRFSHEGVGIRSFIDWKLKGSIWISGGYESNYKSSFRDFAQLRDKNSWQQSGLIGISKLISMKTKLFKKTSIKILFDFLSYQEVPRTQPIIFRMGYTF